MKTLQQHAQRYGNVRRLLSQSNLNLQEPTVSLVSATVWATAAVILVLFVAAYCSINPNMYIEGFLRFFPQKRRTQVRTVLTETGSALKWWVFGRLIAMAVVGVITAVGLVIVKVPMAFPLALVATLLTFVPYVGAIASAIPALMIGFTVSTQTALYVALVFLIAHATEGYIVGPTIQRRFVYLPPALILANQFLMQVLVGIVGVALATPFLVVVMCWSSGFISMKNGRIAKKQLRQLSPLQPRASIVQPEKLNHRFDVPLAANVVGDPPGLGVVVMQVCSACSNQFFTNPNGKREIRESVAVQMPDLAMSHMEEDQPSNMRRDSNSGPGGYFTLNLRGNRLARH